MQLCGLTLCFIAVHLCGVVWSMDLYKIIEKQSDLTEFFNQLELNDNAKYLLEQQSVTVFAPTNDAWARYKGSADFAGKESLLNYHFVKSAITSDKFPKYLPTEAIGSLPIWLNRQDSDKTRSNSKYEYFVNHGRIIRIDIKGKSSKGHEQVLHVIDQVLEPTLSQSSDFNSMNPSAYRLLEHPDQYGITERLQNFYGRVSSTANKPMLFQGGDGSTFFFPVDEMNSQETWDRVDEKVIDGHIIPKKVFFSTAFPFQPQESLAFTDNLKTLISMRNESNTYDRDNELTVQSNTVVSYHAYPKGTVVARIVRANIPVKNGVVHLIANPLIVSNKNVLQLLEQNPQLKELSIVLQNHGQDLANFLAVGSDFTLFAPSNLAFRNLDAGRHNMVFKDEAKVKQMLRLHIAPQIISTESIVQGAIGIVNTLDENRKLHFSYTMHNVTVVGGGVNATIVTPDILATNGIVQIIDRLMGVPYHSIYEKLQSDTSLSSSFKLGEQGNFNEQFKDLTRKFTYFVPHNDAWNTVKSELPSEYKKLFSGNFFYHANKVLGRNLIVNNAYSISKLLTMKKVQMKEGEFSFSEENGRVFANWEGERSEVIDSDVDTNNGKVHILRRVLFKRNDLTGGSALASPFLSLLTLMLSALLVKFIV